MRHLSEKTNAGFEYFGGALRTVEVFRVLSDPSRFHVTSHFTCGSKVAPLRIIIV